MADARARWAVAWRAARALEQAERAAVRGECGLPPDRERRMDALEAARMLVASPVALQAIEAAEAVDTLEGRRTGNAGNRARSLLPLRKYFDGRMDRFIGASVRYDPARLRGLERPRCRVCGWPADGGWCLPDLCRNVDRPAWPKGHTPCAP